MNDLEISLLINRLIMANSIISRAPNKSDGPRINLRLDEVVISEDYEPNSVGKWDEMLCKPEEIRGHIAGLHLTPRILFRIGVPCYDIEL